MNVGEGIRKAAKDDDKWIAVIVVDHLRFNERLTYDQCQRLFETVGGVTPAKFEQWMQDADGYSQR